MILTTIILFALAYTLGRALRDRDAAEQILCAREGYWAEHARRCAAEGEARRLGVMVREQREEQVRLMIDGGVGRRGVL